MASCSSSASRLPSPRFRSTWCRGAIGHCRRGRPSFAIIWRGLRRLISLWFRRLPLSNCSRFLFSAIDGERVLADIDSDHGNGSVEFLRHGVLLVFGAPCWLRLLEHGRTIPLADLIASRPPSGLPPLLCCQWLPRYIVLHRTPEMDCARTSHDREAALSTRSDQAITLR
jgi:hypothetical protein